MRMRSRESLPFRGSQSSMEDNYISHFIIRETVRNATPEEQHSSVGIERENNWNNLH